MPSEPLAQPSPSSSVLTLSALNFTSPNSVSSQYLPPATVGTQKAQFSSCTSGEMFLYTLSSIAWRSKANSSASRTVLSLSAVSGFLRDAWSNQMPSKLTLAPKSSLMFGSFSLSLIPGDGWGNPANTSPALRALSSVSVSVNGLTIALSTSGICDWSQYFVFGTNTA